MSPSIDDAVTKSHRKKKIDELSKSIRKKYLALKLGKSEEDEALEKRFKPVTAPLKEIATTSSHRLIEEIEKFKSHVKKEMRVEKKDENNEESDEESFSDSGENSQMEGLTDDAISEYVEQYPVKSQNVKKAAIAETALRTLKSHLYKYFSLNGTYKWVDILPEITKNYNGTIHRTTGYKPRDVNISNEEAILKLTYSHIKIMGKPKFKVGDIVRVSKSKHVFEKSYKPNWTTELFKIVKVQITNPITSGVRISCVPAGFYADTRLTTAQAHVMSHGSSNGTATALHTFPALCKGSRRGIRNEQLLHYTTSLDTLTTGDTAPLASMDRTPLPITYLLENMQEHPTRGGFSEELQKTSNPDIFLVEKVLKRKGKKVFVRWLGFDKSHDSWIDITNVV
ncbi:hypothetical protein NQ315_006626 [Exocentrus adspersus]|uniref:Chromo domain-containing protein n=1 Tax=Exocentrus adspersus TaxID=1586481 RepID=A0AAV8VE50_9CUCU|nr:hypothetical protein NQ315_006626 [Exocentrus adspersus]